MKIRPLYDRILATRLDKEAMSAGGIIIPDTAKEKPLEGKVVAVGKGKRLDNGDIRPVAVGEGDKILFGKYAGTEIKIDGTDYLILREEDILAVFED